MQNQGTIDLSVVKKTLEAGTPNDIFQLSRSMPTGVDAELNGERAKTESILQQLIEMDPILKNALATLGKDRQTSITQKIALQGAVDIGNKNAKSAKQYGIERNCARYQLNIAMNSLREISANIGEFSKTNRIGNGTKKRLKEIRRQADECLRTIETLQDMP